MRTNYGICIRVWVYRPMLRYICYYSTLMTAFLQVKKHRNTPQARLRPTSPALRATSPCRGGFGIPQSFPSSPEAPLLGELSNEVRLRGCTKGNLTIAAQRLFRAGLALSVTFGDTSPKGRGFGRPGHSELDAGGPIWRRSAGLAYGASGFWTTHLVKLP